MAQKTAKAEHVIEDLAGCGLFQVSLLAVVLLVCKSAVAYTVLYMSFGIYNPGWKCLDNHIESPYSPANFTDGAAITSSAPGAELGADNITADDNDAYDVRSCQDFEKCRNIEFDPATSTLVTEWGLVCDKAWVIKVIISVQMVGMLIGSYASGQLSDLIGRKRTLCLGIVVCSLCLLVSSFSVSWVMFLVLRFFTGVSVQCNLLVTYLYVSEYMTRRWRAVCIAIPVWYVGGTVLSVTSWIFKDWRYVERFGCIFTGLGLIPVFWIPESLRWLEVKHKRSQFVSVSEKILRFNKKNTSYCLENISWIDNFNNSREKGHRNDKKYTVCDLFRKGFKLITICLVTLLFSTSLIYYAVTFGAKSFYGDFYFNLLIANFIPLPLCCISMLVMNFASRRVHTASFYGFGFICSAISVGILFSNDAAAKNFGSTVLIALSRGALDGAWMGMYARTTELYPTVVRGTGVGVVSLASRFGGILAPYLIPSDKSILYVFVIIMTIVTLLCCVISMKLPETKGKSLKETFGDKANENNYEKEIDVPNGEEKQLSKITSADL